MSFGARGFDAAASLACVYSVHSFSIALLFKAISDNG
jgi:hypothetical protein